jgi:Tol biopolymer transport system component
MLLSLISRVARKHFKACPLVLSIIILGLWNGQARAETTSDEHPGGYAGFENPGTAPMVFAPGLVSTDAYEFAVTFTPDMRKIYFTRRRDPGPNRILVAATDRGRLGKPVPAAFSRPGGEYEACVSPDGNSITFAQADSIWISARDGNTWSPARALPPQINKGFTMAVWSDAEGNLYFTRRGGLQVAYRTKDGFQPAVSLGPHFQPPAGDAAHGFIAPDGSYLIFDSQGRPEGKGRADLYISFRNEDLSWTEPANLEALNTPVTEMCPCVSPDGRFLFFCRDGDIYWVDASIIQEYR